MDIEQTPDSRRTASGQAAYIANLKELRQDYGCTSERLMQQVELYAALKERAARNGRQPTLGNCITELKESILSLADAERRMALLVALGFDEHHQGSKLGDRRESYLLSFDVRDRPSERTIVRWENRAVNDVASSIGGDKSFDRDQKSLKPTNLKPVNSLVTTYYGTTCFYSNRGILTHLDVTRKVRAVEEDSDPHIYGSHTYLTETGPEVSEITPLFGCSLEGVQRLAGGSIITTMRIYKRLSPKDGEYTYAFRRSINGTQTTDPVVWWEPEFTVTRYEVRLVFQGEMKPTRAWWFSKPVMPFGLVEPDNSEGRNLELLNNGHYVYKIFFDASPHHCHGVAWTWKEKDV